MDPVATIKKLERDGYRVEVHHGRLTFYAGEVYRDYGRGPGEPPPMASANVLPVRQIRLSGQEPSTTGGRTRVSISLEDQLVAEGHALCSPLDNYSRRLGLTIALGRALLQLEEEGG